MSRSIFGRRTVDFGAAVAGSLADGTIGVDRKGRCTFVDARAEKLLGWTEAELAGKDLHKIIHRCAPDDGTRVPGGKCPLWEASHSRVTFRCDTELIQRKDGATISVIYTSSPLFQNGQIMGTVFAFHDMTAREWEMVQLRESEYRYRALVEAAPEIMWLTDQFGYITLANQYAADVFGYDSPDEMRGLSSLELIVPEDRPRSVHEKRKLTEPGMRSTVEQRLLRKDGTTFPAEVSVSAVLEPDKGLKSFLSMARDVTHHKQAEYSVRAGELSISMEQAVTSALAGARSLVETLPSLLEAVCTRGGWDVGTFWSVDMTDQVLRCRAIWHQPSLQIQRFKALSRQLSVAPGIDLPGRVWSSRQPVWIEDVVSDADILRALMASKEGLHAAFCFPILVEGVVHGVMEFFSREVRPPDQAAIEATMTTGNQIGRFLERQQVEKSLEYQASHDMLTDLPNRSLLHVRLQRAVLVARAARTPLALFLLDLDGFKGVNDTYGHRYGDLLLKQVAKRIQAALRDSDTVARLGGDEFAVLLPGANEEGAITVAKKILSSLEQPFVVEAQSLTIGGSVGISLYPEHGEEPEVLMQCADVAMYMAKRSKSGHAVYSPDQESKPAARRRPTIVTEPSTRAQDGGHSLSSGQVG